jgi:CRP/FNR family transcriptional regulator, cyclic AMP receptor protein
MRAIEAEDKGAAGVWADADGEIETVPLLDLDADLAATVPEQDLELARRGITAPAWWLEPGPWEPERESDDPGCLGLLVLDGLLTREVSFAGHRSLELLGEGDLLRPWDVEPEIPAPSPVPAWSILEPARLARLDRRLLQLGTRWPQVVEELIGRSLLRSRWLAVRLAIASVTRVDRRLLLFFWHAATRWGRVTPEGTLIPLSLTHELLGALIGARRPTVTTALTQLRESGEVEPSERGWMLRGEPVGSIPDPE